MGLFDFFCTRVRFKKMFSIPVSSIIILHPGQSFSLAVPEGKKIIITDVYVENLGGGMSALQIFEQAGANAFRHRHTFRTKDGGRTVVNFTTGLRLGDEAPIRGSIRIQNADASEADIKPLVNGIFV